MGSDEEVNTDFGSLSHELADSVDTIFIKGLVIRTRRLGYGLPVEHVLLVSLSYEKESSILLDDQVPGVLSLARGHQGSSGHVAHEDIGDTVLGKLLDDRVFPDLRVVKAVTLELRDLAWLSNLNSVAGTIEVVNFTGICVDTAVNGLKVGELVESLLGEFLDELPFRLDLVGRFTEASSHPDPHSLVLLAGHVRLLGLLLPLLSLLGHSRPLELVSHVLGVLDTLVENLVSVGL